ncbi:MAG: (5-formylfuran-3-yl)methyl phosphate synthase [Actinobacteria bacterium]|nr:(5-formylfuran-3-yl)methyl phosphate synthase [Actinomycetota bacterium]
MQLLVSVVHEEEVAAATAGGADIIDVKNPREGSLGANFPHVIRRVRELTPPGVPVSAAIGDAPNLPGMVALAAAGAAACGVQYVKVGLLGPRESRDALLLLTEVCRAARAQDRAVRIMATAYADARKIGSFPPLDLPMVAAEAGADGCMLDTASKNGATLLSELGAAELEAFVAGCRSVGLLCALAGSLREEDVPRIHELGPDIIGVRTAACRGDRLTGRVDQDAVRSLKHRIAALESLPSGPSRAALRVVPAVPR